MKQRKICKTTKEKRIKTYLRTKKKRRKRGGKKDKKRRRRGLEKRGKGRRVAAKRRGKEERGKDRVSGRRLSFLKNWFRLPAQRHFGRSTFTPLKFLHPHRTWKRKGAGMAPLCQHIAKA